MAGRVYAASRAASRAERAERALSALNDVLNRSIEDAMDRSMSMCTDGFADLAADGSVPTSTARPGPGGGEASERAVVLWSSRTRPESRWPGR